MIERIKNFKLKNGIDVVLLHSSDSYSVTISAYTRSGAALESNNNNGITHFIEHCILTETKNWPSSAKLYKEVEFRGGRRNGYTSYEVCKFYISLPYNELKFGLDYIYDVTVNGKFSQKTIEKQRGIILDELSQSKNDIYEQNHNFVIKSMLLNKTGYSKDILGFEDNIKNFDTKKLKNYYKAMMAPENLVISIAGKFDGIDLKKELKKFESIPRSKIKTEVRYPNENLAKNLIDYKVSKKSDLVLANIIFNLRSTLELSEKDIEIIKFVGNILSGPLSSRLKHRLREKEHLLYHIDLNLSIFRGYSFADVFFESTQAKFEKILRITLLEINKLLTKGITKTELDRYKNYIVNRRLMHYEDIFNLIELYDKYVLNFKKINTLEELNEITESITLNEVNTMLKMLKSNLSISILTYGNTNADINKKSEIILKESL